MFLLRQTLRDPAASRNGTKKRADTPVPTQGTHSRGHVILGRQAGGQPNLGPGSAPTPTRENLKSRPSHPARPHAYWPGLGSRASNHAKPYPGTSPAANLTERRDAALRREGKRHRAGNAAPDQQTSGPAHPCRPWRSMGTGAPPDRTLRPVRPSDNLSQGRESSRRLGGEFLSRS